MTARSPLRRLAVPLFAASLALAVGACGSQDAEATQIESAAPLATVPPPTGQTWAEVAAVTAEGGYLIGNPDAPIKLVEYASLTCPACAAFSQAAAQPLDEEYVNSGRVSFELRSFLIHGPLDLALTRLIECGQPAAVHPLANQVWANLDQILNQAQAAQPQLEAALQQPPQQRFVAFAQAAGLYDFFAARGIPETQARQCLADTAAIERLANNSQQYGQDGVNSTPTFFLNGQQLDGNQWPAVEAALQRAGAR
ncbi:thioredoxin domain-containing protein [Porphyrobacter sp. GA68]|uniref:thioredoxin domain-containing protein n=1 Tax=Porphyrobacter sp. GA68 TaxID=2883480 RepID=UPI001D17EEEB|nr:thioredoxin domain-containing protein [Porphyrobacter sp. GA68]